MKISPAARSSASPLLSPFSVTGAAAIVIGGMVSAAFAGRPSYLASWAVAYGVLVVGVAQIAFGAGIGHLAVEKLAPRLAWSIYAFFNLGNLAVLTGTLVKDRFRGGSWLIDLGGVLLVVSFALGARAVRGAEPSWLLLLYRGLTGILLVSVMIGLVLAHS